MGAAEAENFHPGVSWVGLGLPRSATPPKEDVWLASWTESRASSGRKFRRGGEGTITAAACLHSKSPSQITSVILRTLERIPVNLIYTGKSH